MIEKNTGLHSELEKSPSRNDIIREALLDGRVPMLPFERRQLEIDLLGHAATQSELATLLGEAMTTTSETWHDNAQADAVNMQSQILESQAKGVIGALKDSLIVSYEHDEHDKVSIGAVARLLIGQYPETVFVTGKQRSLPGEVLAIVGEDTVAVSMHSPIGAAIFDQSEGNVVSYKVGEREMQVTVVSIAYPDITSIES